MNARSVPDEPQAADLDIVRDPETRRVSMFDPEDIRGERWLQCDEELLVEVRRP